MTTAEANNEFPRPETWDDADTGRYARTCSSCGDVSHAPLPRGEIEMLPFCEECR